MPASSAAAMTSSSRIEPPGCMAQVAPASTAEINPSANGKNASDCYRAPFVRSSLLLAASIASTAFLAAIRDESNLLIWPAPMPTVVKSRA